VRCGPWFEVTAVASDFVPVTVHDGGGWNCRLFP
jgi:hypothetical protein